MSKKTTKGDSYWGGFGLGTWGRRNVRGISFNGEKIMIAENIAVLVMFSIALFLFFLNR
jgi:hypothetical protein